MKNLSLLLCSLLLNGVFGDTEVKVSVKEGDSVTLTIHPKDKNGAERLVWWFKGVKIANIDLEGTPPPVYPDVRFRDRLNLERQNGSLTITNITSEDSGEYKLQNKGKEKSKYKIFRVSVSVSVMEGDYVTLHTGVTDGKNVTWKFNGADIPDSTFINCEVNPQTGDLNITKIRRNQSGEYEVRINGREHRIFCIGIRDKMNTVSVMEGDSFTLTGVTGGKIDDVKSMFKGGDVILNLERLPNCGVNHQTGDLNITNIRHNQSGEYEVRINGSSFILHRTYRVNVSVKSESVSANVGADCTLCHDITDMQRADVIQWTFEGTLIAHSHRMLNDPDRFSGRLSLNMSGCLTIKNFGSKDSGLYEVNITGSKHIIHKNFSVTAITERGLSTGQWTGIICGVVLLVIAVIAVGVIAYRRNKYKQQKQKVKEMTVLERQSVTLETYVTKLQSDDVIEWSFRDEEIAKLKKNKISGDERFRDRLDKQTGSLIITNIRTEDAGLYKVKISSSSRKKSFLQFITGGGPSYYQFSVTVTERIKPVELGGSVTLETGFTEIQTGDVIKWTFENDKTIIAEMTVGTEPSYVSTDERFRNRLKMNPKTGDLTISNITTELSGVYKAQIIISSSRGSKDRDYRVVISVIADRGKSLTLNTESKIQSGTEIKWISEDETILETVKNGDKSETKYTDDERFRDRLKMNHQTGDLTITDIRQTDDGLYILQEINSDGKISCRIFSVLVRDGHSTNHIKQNSGTEGNESTTVVMPLLNEAEDRL